MKEHSASGVEEETISSKPRVDGVAKQRERLLKRHALNELDHVIGRVADNAADDSDIKRVFAALPALVAATREREDLRDQLEDAEAGTRAATANTRVFADQAKELADALVTERARGRSLRSVLAAECDKLCSEAGRLQARLHAVEAEPERSDLSKCLKDVLAATQGVANKIYSEEMAKIDELWTERMLRTGLGVIAPLEERQERRGGEDPAAEIEQKP